MSMKNKFNKVLSDFSNEEKVFLYNFLYEDLSGKGVCGDTELAHVNKHEMDVLRSMGGAGTINENTKCVQFFGSPPPPPPVQTTSVQTKEIPKAIEPYVKKVLSEAEEFYDIDKETGYVPYTGKRIADFSTEQERAFDLTSDIVGQTASFTNPAAQLAGLVGLGTTDADISRFMNPYNQLKIDVEKREARRAGDVERQRIGYKAAGRGAYGGSRQAILEAEANRNLQQTLGDIQARGQAEAFDNALKQAQAQQDSRLGAVSGLTDLARVASSGTAQELARLEAVGAARRGQSQAELDIAEQEFFQEKDYPKTALREFSEFIQPTQRSLGAAGTTTNRGPGQAQPTYLQQTAGLIGALGSAGSSLGMSDPREKTDVKKIGMDDATGLAMYSFRYKDDPKTYPKVVGPMSNEVKEKYPELVSEVDGTEVVDFGGLASIANMNKEENVASLRQGGLVSLKEGGSPTSFKELKEYYRQQAENERREKEIINSNVDDPEDEPYPFTEEEKTLLANSSVSPNSSVPKSKEEEEEEGLLSFLTKPTEIDPKRIQGPSRLDKISDLLIGYSQADPSKPLGIQLGQAAAGSSAKQAKERQQMLANILANRRLEAEEKLLDIKSAKALDISSSTANSLRDSLLKVAKGAGLIEDAEKKIVIKAAEDAIKGKQGRNVSLIKIMLNRFKTPAGRGGNESTVLGPSGKAIVVGSPPPQPSK